MATLILHSTAEADWNGEVDHVVHIEHNGIIYKYEDDAVTGDILVFQGEEQIELDQLPKPVWETLTFTLEQYLESVTVQCGSCPCPIPASVPVRL